MTQELAVEYRGAVLRLTFENTPHAALSINGICRETVSSDDEEITLRLNSTVQTDYEWHEFIDARVQYGVTEIEASISANSQELKALIVRRDGAPREDAPREDAPRENAPREDDLSGAQAHSGGIEG